MIFGLFAAVFAQEGAPKTFVAAIEQSAALDLPLRIEMISKSLIGLPYVLDAEGEGEGRSSTTRRSCGEYPSRGEHDRGGRGRDDDEREVRGDHQDEGHGNGERDAERDEEGAERFRV